MENNMLASAIERVRTYYSKGFMAALEMVEQAGNLEVVKANSDKILDEIFGVVNALKEDDDGDKSE